METVAGALGVFLCSEALGLSQLLFSFDLFAHAANAFLTLKNKGEEEG